MNYYDPDGKPITREEWVAAAIDDVWEREHLITQITDDVHVSTVWMGLDHQYGDGPPLIFETMVFGLASEIQWRYSTRDEARQGHEKACQRARFGVWASFGEVSA